MSKKNTFSFLLFNGCILANVLVGVAEAHYGFIYSSKDIARCLQKPNKNKKLQYSTTEAERARLAETSFNYFGLIFQSYAEVKNVAILFEANYQNKYFNTEKELKAAFTEILKMVRGEK